jgi:hypothetical protein
MDRLSWQRKPDKKSATSNVRLCDLPEVDLKLRRHGCIQLIVSLATVRLLKRQTTGPCRPVSLHGNWLTLAISPRLLPS